MNLQNAAQNANVEAGWKTYLKAMVFILPALMAWEFACMFLVPKLREICSLAGIQPSKVGWLWDAPFFLVKYGRILFIAVVLIVVLLELLGCGWARQRKLTVSIVVWLAGVFVLFGLTTLLILVLIAAPSLSQTK